MEILFNAKTFGDAYIKAIWKDYGNALDELYIQYPKWESNAIFNDLCNLFIKYYEQYEIFISETSKRNLLYKEPALCKAILQ